MGVIPKLQRTNIRSAAIYAGAIVVPVGNISHGYAHIERKHKRNIEKYHPGMDLKIWICNVLRSRQRIFRQRDGSLWLIRENGTRKCAVVQLACLDGIDLYKLITAYPLPREPDFIKRGAEMVFSSR